MEVLLHVKGMMCHHCEATVKKAVEALPGVTEATADFEKGTVEVKLSAPVDEAVFRKAIEDKDYEFVSCEAR